MKILGDGRFTHRPTTLCLHQRSGRYLPHHQGVLYTGTDHSQRGCKSAGNRTDDIQSLDKRGWRRVKGGLKHHFSRDMYFLDIIFRIIPVIAIG